MRDIENRGRARELQAGRPWRRDGRRREDRSTLLHVSTGAAMLGCILFAVPAPAVELFAEGDLRGSLDTTLSHGLTFRVGKRDDELAAGVNDNDGNLNYDRGLVSNTSKFTTELDVGTGGFGAFARVTGFLDFENENGRRERTPLSAGARDRVARDLEVLDLYVSGAFDLGDAAVDLRFGRHVLNWGESTFIQNGISVVNPFDVSKIRLPGAELREALLPVTMVSASVAPTDVLSVEGFYQLDWEQTRIDPVGSFFSVTDYVGPGASSAAIPLPGTEDLGDTGLTTDSELFPGFALFGYGPDPDFLHAARGADHEAGDSGQWGIALRYLAEELGNTDFGFYYVNYHSRLPLVAGHTGTLQGVQTGLARAGEVAAAVPAIVRAIVTDAVQQAGCPSPDASPQCAALAMGAEAQARAQVSAAAGGVAPAAGIDAYARTGHYFVEYPEDIQLFGVSFNTEIGTTGWALQGEYSYRRGAPFQRAEDDVFADALSPFTDCLAAGAAAPVCVGRNAAAGLYDADTVGFIRRNVSQVQATATRVLGPTLGANGLVFLTEVALMHVHGMPDKDVKPLESPAGGKLETEEALADATSWGYRMAARLDFNNAVGAVNLFPYVQLQHDVGGNSPTPSGSFVEGRTALTLGLRADYLSRWEADVGYTRYAGEGSDLSDRDFVSASIKYSF